ncbi:hypothetical protein L1049_020601 [Liquidambar formosana]|uniref:Uncharacterized protein n=1 Tax=Liquidambar formosana TaxID=63359 RepID=A0AAP0S857_LIQFO
MSNLPSSSASTSASSQFTYTNGSYFPMPFHLQQSDPSMTAAVQYPKPYVPPPTMPAVQVPAPPVKVPVYPAPAPVAGVYTLPQYQQVRLLIPYHFAFNITPCFIN